ncbi:hypothetical protein PAAL109150_06915 [Paenibacillus alkaliterrae]|nr:hypothetical protein [Paenibacillus alkaliterrae]
MKFRVEGTLHDFDNLDDAIQDGLLKQWHKRLPLSACVKAKGML